MKTPEIIKGGLAVDDRGKVTFVNDFDFARVKRFYTIENHKAGFVRAWHGHHKEEKWVTVLRGSALIIAIPLWAWSKKDPYPPIWRYTLSEHSPEVLYIPGEYANGSMQLTDDALIVHFSSMIMGEAGASGDEVRFPASAFDDVWEVEER